MASPTTKINPPEPELLAALDCFAARVATIVVDRLRAGSDPDWVDQHASPLGPRRHCTAVRRRVGASDGAAAIIGRRCLLTPAAIQEELARSTKTKAPAEDTEAFAAELGLKLVKGGKR